MSEHLILRDTDINSFKQDIQLANQQFRTYVDNSLYLRGEFFNLSSDLTAHSVLQPQPDLKEIVEQLKFIQQDLWNIGTIIFRLQWMQGLYRKGEIDEAVLHSFASLDIDHFHIEIKSLMDYSANLIRLVSSQPGVVPKNSLRSLYEWMSKKSSHKNILGQRSVDLIQKCSWFPEYSKIRDGNIHNGAFTLVFSADDNGIFFQNYHKMNNQIFSPILMQNENLVDFKKYAVLAFSRVLCILEGLAEVIRQKHTPQRHGIGDTRVSGHGFNTYLKWSNDFLGQLNAISVS